jgi:hypothetical protein
MVRSPMSSNSVYAQVAKTFSIPALFALIWVLAYPYETELSFLGEFTHLCLMMTYAVIIYLPLIFAFRILEKEKPAYINFMSIYFAIVFLYSFFFLIYVPHGPNLGVFDFLRDNELMSDRF